MKLETKINITYRSSAGNLSYNVSDATLSCNNGQLNIVTDNGKKTVSIAVDDLYKALGVEVVEDGTTQTARHDTD